MSATLLARGLTLGHDPAVLATDVDLTIAPGHVIGLVGANGAGKTTLLRTLAGLLPARGSIVAAPPSASIGYLPQEVTGADDTETIAQFLARRTGVSDAQTALDAAADALANATPGADDAYAEALERWLALGGADLDVRQDAVLTEVGCGAPLTQPVATLSGGQAARVALASLLLARFDVFCLDEPTNNLDLAGLAQLERFVREQRSAVVLVSHDRAFLSAVTTDIVELDAIEKRAEHFAGGFDAYLAEREVRRRHAREEFEEYAATKAGYLDRANTVRNWTYQGVKGAKAKKKDNDKMVAKKRAESSEKQASKASRLVKAAERLEVVAEPRKVWELRYELAPAERSGDLVASLRSAVVQRGEFTLGPVDLDVHWADRIALTGANGAGKSTLLSLLLGELAPDSGTAIVGRGVERGVLDQRRGFEGTNGTGSLLTLTQQALPELNLPERRTLLAKFGLGSDDVDRPFESLSPGERTRAQLAVFQARGVNLLVLDEPTNHLDLPAIEQLESALDRYTGTLIVVTHDRRMLDALHITRRLALDAGRLSER